MQRKNYEELWNKIRDLTLPGLGKGGWGELVDPQPQAF